MTLAETAMGISSRIVGFASLSERDKLHLSSLGLREGNVITKLLKTPLRDPIECLVGSQLFTVDARLLKHILVEPE